MNESGYIKSIHKQLPKEIHAWKISDRYTSGRPDCCYTGPEARTLWVEYKHDQKAPAAINLVKRVTALQNLWLSKHHKNKHNVCVIYATDSEGAIVLRYPAWQQKIKRDFFLEKLLTKQQLVDWLIKEIL